MPIDPAMLALNFPNSAPAPGYDEGMEGGMPDNEAAEYGPQAGLSPTAAMGASAGSPEALLQTLLQFTGGDPQRLIMMLTQLLSMLTGQQPGAPSQPQGQPPMPF